MRGFNADPDGRTLIHSHDSALFIADLLEEHPDWFESGMSEYSLISRFQSPPYCFFDEQALADPLVMFRTHFVVFHALYTVRDRWREAGVGELDIHTLRIRLNPPLAVSSLPEKADPLRAYYLDWRNLSDTGKEDVDALLDDFWRQAGGELSVVSHAEITEAKQTLGFESDDDLTLQRVKRQYRKLVHVHHPDKGGDERKAKQLVRAFRVLSAHLRQAR